MSDAELEQMTRAQLQDLSSSVRRVLARKTRSELAANFKKIGENHDRAVREGLCPRD